MTDVLPSQRRLARSLAATAAATSTAATAALSLPWAVGLGDTGLVQRAGLTARSTVGGGFGLAALALIVLTWALLRRSVGSVKPLWPGAGSFAAVIAALGCVTGASANDGPGHFAGGAGWIAVAGYLLTAALLGLAVRVFERGPDDVRVGDELRRVEQMLADPDPAGPPADLDVLRD